MSEEAKVCVRKLLNYDAANRPTAAELLLDPFFFCKEQALIISKLKRFAKRGDLQKALLPLVNINQGRRKSHVALERESL